ncbi:MAG: condensation domain-containing protein, partial [Actinobacteria bacterium]|nr:condensation domain-containing protein [Acidobacteriota bacterium]MCA1705994.1 condensation domain-containing protein [Actinomycetota bacterium]
MPTDTEPTLALTGAQTGMWLAQRFAAGRLDYSIAHYIEITGALDPALFKCAVREVFDACEAVRARIVVTAGVPRQVIADTSSFTMPYLDVSGQPRPRDAAMSWMSNELDAPLSSEGGPLYSTALVKVSEDTHFWYMRCHHIAMDGFSAALFVQRTASVYTNLAAGSRPGEGFSGGLRELLDQEAAYRESDAFRADREYWAAKLADRPAPVTFGHADSRHRPGRSRVTRYLEQSEVDAVHALARRAGVVLATVFVAAQFLFVARLTGMRDIVLGFPVTARFGRSARNIPGMVSNVVPLRLIVDPTVPLAEFLGAVSTEMRLALRHQRYRYEDLRHDLGLREDSGPLLGAHVNLQLFDYDLRFADSVAIPHNLTNGPVEDLALVIYGGAEGAPLQVDLDGNSELYGPSDLAGHLESVLRLVTTMSTSDSNRPVGDLDVLDSEDRRRLLIEYNDTGRDLPATTVTALIEAQVARTPDAVALMFRDESLTHVELNERVNRLAHLLAARGIAPEDLVALAVPRSAEMIVSLLAILKAGAAYLPIDPDYPADRVGVLLADARPALVICTTATAHRLSGTTTPQLLIDTEPISR